ncbi:hypothetical protein [Niastella yeongjuensis]|uniref:hypothetical protein n=1 Tax=Niastella yeongjuensis TaxID=354355 RepID=UPI0008B8D191|nr:hypothetical protein [Niastella yeongjuensis]SEP45124.1 hypothetical protein SAMN05660816_06283 [Niastella yeongjuensis]
MKKELFDITALLSFFFSISCKTNTIKSVQCKPGASRYRSAGPHKKISRAYIKLMSAANTSSVAKVRSTGCELLNKWSAAFCETSLVLASVHWLEQ